MTLHLITFSPTGTSLAAARTIASAWDLPAASIDLCRKNIQPATLSKDDIAIIAAPCYGGRIPATAASRLAKIRGSETPAVLCVTFGNRAFEDALLELSDIAIQNGFSVFAGCALSAEHNIMHIFGAGRPDGKDREDLRRFSAAAFAKYQRRQLDMPAFPGNRPYKEWAAHPIPILVDKDACIRCRRCETACPTGAISKDIETDPKTCISCMRCIKLCPAHCRTLPPPLLEGMIQKLAPACRERKENQFYI